mmetsp:Transcript_24249/g.52554  ORF Transcript_24249/g.52554 Transcript_24249/m.52554 type:complete len:89 (+) Transcript_24249:206-472(+)
MARLCIPLSTTTYRVLCGGVGRGLPKFSPIYIVGTGTTIVYSLKAQRELVYRLLLRLASSVHSTLELRNWNFSSNKNYSSTHANSNRM